MSENPEGRFTTRPETPDDIAVIHRINTAAFSRPDEADLVDQLRRDGDLVLSHVVCNQLGEVCGHIAFSRLRTEGSTMRASALAPVAILPDMQRQGAGSVLIRSALQQLTRDGEDLVLVLGEPDYYRRFGFEATLAAQVKTPYDGHYQQAVALTQHGKTFCGALSYAAAFAELE